MRVVALWAFAILAIAGCSRAEKPSPLPAISGDAAPRPAALSATPAAEVPGWTTSGGDFLLLGKQAPAFSAKDLGGADISLESLRGRWTIVGFQEIGGTDAQEDAFAAALSSAVGQDPELDFLIVLSQPDPPTSGASRDWIRRGPHTKAALDTDRKVAAAFGVTDFPTYLLIGPDLTIEAVRGALSSTPDNGIKDVIRGVAEIKKQIADPT